MKRYQQDPLLAQLTSNKIVLLSGPRLAGKEELIISVLEHIPSDVLQINMSNKKERKLIEEASITELTATFHNFPIVVIHEAQYLSNLQSMIEEVLSGTISSTILLSCSYEPLLDELLKEVLEAQGLHFKVLPPSFYELATANGLPEEEKLLEQRLIFGAYPPVAQSQENAEEILKHLLDTIIVTDLGVTDRINKGDQLLKMMQILAFSIGEPISYNEVAEKCGLDNETAERYISLLEKAYILIKLPSFSTEQRYELKKSHCIYFVDNGVRNMLINNFNPTSLRNDLNELWLNWLISERMKWNNLQQKEAKYSFWRTHTKQSVEFIEEQNGVINGYKATWEKRKKIKFPAMYGKYYPTHHLQTLNRSTYWGFLTKK
jgi:hypothetical protein